MINTDQEVDTHTEDTEVWALPWEINAAQGSHLGSRSRFCLPLSI